LGNTLPAGGNPPANLLGAYGPWVEEREKNRLHPLSFTSPKWTDIDGWKQAAREKFAELIALPQLENLPPEAAGQPQAARQPRAARQPQAAIAWTSTYASTYDGLEISELTWQTPFGPPTKAFFLKPAGLGKSEKIPGILAFHDHGGFKYFGKEKITRTAAALPPLIEEHQRIYYGGAAWANELARQGFGVLVPDGFLFGSRRVNPTDIPELAVRQMLSGWEERRELTPEDWKTQGDANSCRDLRYIGKADADIDAAFPHDADFPREADRIAAYNQFAAAYEDTAAKSLFCSGLTWPGISLYEDRLALDILCSLPEIDSERIGCGGLSGGGLRTNYLAGYDERIRCSVTAGFMTTWKDFALHTSFTHTWMIYIPLLSQVMDYPDILSMRAPSPSLVLAAAEDPLFTWAETQAAFHQLAAVYAKAGHPEALKTSSYAGAHRFDLDMQKEAFSWFRQWLG
jgi:dienelactone hydrolase